jgi:sugar lactone lactonase YvrE
VGVAVPYTISTYSTGFSSPSSIVTASDGTLYVSDVLNHVINRIASDGSISVFAGSVRGYRDDAGTNAQFNNPYSLAIDSSGNIYVADRGNNMIRKISPNQTVTTVAGQLQAGSVVNGNGTVARFNSPSGLAVDANRTIYVADTNNNVINPFPIIFPPLEYFLINPLTCCGTRSFKY